MKLTSVILAVLLAINFASNTQASTYSGGSCSGGSNDAPSCIGKTLLTDWTYFNNTFTSDTAGSAISNGDLLPQPNGYGGTNANVLAKNSDFVNWSHHFIFNPPVKQGGILDAWITLSLRDFETDLVKKDTSDDEKYHDGEKDNDGNERIKKGSKEYKVNFKAKCDPPTGSTTDTSNESAKLLLEGSNWITINDVDTGIRKFDVVLTGLYDGKFDVQLISTLNDFAIEWSKLEIEYCPESAAPVPEPSTFLLLGVGLLGAGLLRRKVTK